MSGELINTSKEIESNDIFNRGIGGFSSKSINDLLDVDGDGVVSRLEQDRMESAGVLNTLQSIPDVVARAFSDENFRIQTGAYLTHKQRVDRERLVLAINKAILVEEMKKLPKKRIEAEQFHIEEEELDIADLKEDIAHRQYLEQGEIDNDV
jgi:hypothetical protein